MAIMISYLVGRSRDKRFVGKAGPFKRSLGSCGRPDDKSKHKPITREQALVTPGNTT